MDMQYYSFKQQILRAIYKYKDVFTKAFQSQDLESNWTSTPIQYPK